MGVWVDIPLVQAIVLILLGVIASKIGDGIQERINRSHALKTGHRLECDASGCNFSISSSDTSVAKGIMESHRESFHLV